MTEFRGQINLASNDISDGRPLNGSCLKENTLSEKIANDDLVKIQKSSVQIRLLKGAIYRQKQSELWTWLERDQYQIRQYFAEIGLSLLLDESEGYAFLRQIDFEEDQEQTAAIALPRLITKRALPFAQSLLLVLIRKRLAEHDSEESSPRLIITRSEIHQWLQPYFQTNNNELKQQREFNALINKVSELGFIRVLRNYEDEFEVQRIIKAFINAEHIAHQLTLLTAYARNKSVGLDDVVQEK
ncbi:MAG: DUF4194 domain-containing protein [Alteromonadaceae bacterium]|nr:DUF4194 domain-containing protein [Alteromonadaceae bacterium]